MLFRRPGQPVSYILGQFQTADRAMAKSKMGEEEAYLTKKQKKKIQVKRCDIGNVSGGQSPGRLLSLSVSVGRCGAL